MIRLLALPVFLAAACVQSNEAVIADLERLAVDSPDPAADALLAQDWPAVPLRGPARAVALPMERSRLPTVRGSVNGVGLPLVLDTGSDGVLLSGEAARRVRLHVPPGETGRAVSPGFDARYRRGVFRELRLGPLAFGRGVANIALEESRSFGPGRAYGIVGCSVLGRFRVTFDFKEREVRIESHGRPPLTRTMLTGVLVEGRRYWLLVDSGAARPFLEPWAAIELGLIGEDDAVRHAGKSGALGRSRITSVRVPSLVVAGRAFEDVRAGVVNTFGDVEPEGGIRPAGLLGLAGFGKLVWTVDFGERRLHVED